MADAKKEEPTKPTPEEKLAAAEAEVDALVKKGLKALDDFEKLDQKQVDRIVAKASVAALIGACGDRRPKAKAYEGTSNLRKGGIRSANQCWLLRRWYISDSSSSFSNWRAVVFSSMTASSTPAMRAKSSQASRPTEVVMQVW